MKTLRAVFVVGVGRSGTSLLQSMLSARGDLAFPPETGFLRRYAPSGTISKLARRASTQDIASFLLSDFRLKRTALPIESIVNQVERDGGITDIAVYRAILNYNAKAAGKPYVGDKDPRLVEFLSILHTAYPEADVIQIIRDPRDVLASKKKASWSRRRSTVAHVLAYRVQLALGRRDGFRWFGNSYHEIRYESLLQNPQAELEKLCRNLSLSFEPGMLQFSAAARSLVTPEEESWKKETMGPLLQSNTGMWHDSLTYSEIALVETACAVLMREFGYLASDAWQKLGLRDRAQIVFLATAISVASSTYMAIRLMLNWLARRRL